MVGNEEPGGAGWSSTARSSARFLTAVNLRMELTIMSSMREAKLASARATTPAVASTVWKRYAVRGRRPAPWMIWHSRLPLASIASIGASGFWSLGLGLE